jgi:hypothetical protein
MDVSFTPFDPIAWLIFGAFVVFTYLIVRIFRRKYPDYPGKLE